MSHHLLSNFPVTAQTPQFASSKSSMLQKNLIAGIGPVDLSPMSHLARNAAIGEFESALGYYRVASMQ